MTNKEKLIETFNLGDVRPYCSCTSEEVRDSCKENGKCVMCRMWLDAEYEEVESDE